MILRDIQAPSLLLSNIRSLSNKMDELRYLFSVYKPGCVAITETWLSEDIPDDLYLVHNYDFFRKDRCGRVGGGVCIWLHKCFKPLLLETHMPSSVDSIAVKLPLLNVVIWCFYVPPNLSACCHRELADDIIVQYDEFLKIDANVKFMLCGDFNDFDTGLFSHHLLCVNRVLDPTRGVSLLDQIWISESLCQFYPSSATIGPPIAKSDHSCVYLESVMPKLEQSSSIRVVYDFRHVRRFVSVLMESEFDRIYKAVTADDKCEIFYELFYNAMSVIPRREVVMHDRDKLWLTPLIKVMIEDRWEAFRAKDWSRYNRLKKKISSAIMRAKQTWADDVLQKKSNIWDMVRELKGNSKSVNASTLSEDDIKNLTKVFSSNFNDKVDEPLNCLQDEPWSITIEPQTVWKLLRNLKCKQATGPDDVSARLLKEAADIIYEPLVDIFRCSVNTRIFPEFWKNAYVRPVPKKKNPTVHDFRQISLTSIISKIFERVILMGMKESFINSTSSDQHAFRPNGSTTSALISIHDTITSFLEKKDTMAVRVTCLDMAKAFDKVHYNRLLNILNDFGFNHGFLIWLESFLKDRCNRISVDGVHGPVTWVKSGLPQGSVLGPYLFSLFMSTLTISADDACLVKYADDITLVECLQRNNPAPNNMPLVLKWVDCNKMSLNFSKCCQFFVRKTRDFVNTCYPSIDVTDSVTILGVIWKDDLSWCDHFDKVCKIASRRLHILRVMKAFIAKEKLIEVFKGIILPVLFYSTQLFGKLSMSILQKLRRVVRRAHHIICLSKICTCEFVPDVNHCREKLLCDFLFKCEKPAHPLHDLVPQRLNITQHFCLPVSKTSRRANSFFPYACLLANARMLNCVRGSTCEL